MAWRNPTPTVDVIIALDPAPTDAPASGEGAPRSGSEPAVVLIRRANPPHGWALPGGFVDEGETVEAAARREAAEETGLRVQLEALLHVYSDPARDPRQHTLSTVFTARASGAPEARDDAAAVLCLPLSTLREVLAGTAALPAGLGLAFDHARILADYLRFRDTGRRPAVDGDGGAPVAP